MTIKELVEALEAAEDNAGYNGHTDEAHAKNPRSNRSA